MVSFAIQWHESATDVHESSHPSGLFQSTGFDCLLHAANLHWSFILHMAIYMFQSYFLKLYHPHLLPQNPKVCSLQLCLFCCLAYRVVTTVFLNSIYIYVNMLYWCSSFWLISLYLLLQSVLSTSLELIQMHSFYSWVIFLSYQL